MSKNEKTKRDIDPRVKKTLEGPIGQALKLKAKSPLYLGECSIEGCKSALKHRNAALCEAHRRLIRKMQWRQNTDTYWVKEYKKENGKRKPERRLAYRRGKQVIPTWWAVRNAKAARLAAAHEKNWVGPLLTAEGRAEFNKALNATRELVSIVEKGMKTAAQGMRKSKEAKAAKKVKAAKKAQPKPAPKKPAPKPTVEKPTLKELISGKGEAVAAAVAEKVATA